MLRMLPQAELTRVPSEFLKRYYPEGSKAKEA